jgi:hypothetical protein
MDRRNTAPPDGIEDQHVRGPDAHHRRANPASLILIGLFLLLACLGLMGGQSHPNRSVENAAARLTVASPDVLRNGMFFETRLLIEPRQPIKEVVLAVSPDLWRDITINSAIPAADKEEYADGMIRMSFGPAQPGKPIAIKFDGQVNPPLVGRSQGEVVLYDGDRRLLALPWTLRVLP